MKPGYRGTAISGKGDMNSGFDHLHFPENWHPKSDERRKQNIKEITDDD